MYAGGVLPLAAPAALDSGTSRSKGGMSNDIKGPFQSHILT